MEKEKLKVPEDLRRQWEEIKAAASILKEHKGKIVSVQINGKESRYVKRHEVNPARNAKIIKIREEVCDTLCKYPDMYSKEEWETESGICQKCPLTRLTI